MERMARAGLYVWIGLCVTSGASAQELAKCEKPAGKAKIESFSVAMPLSVDEAYNLAVEAFVEAGFVPNSPTQIVNQVQWTSGADYNALDGATRTRYIRALVFAKGSGAMVNVSAFEEVTGDASNGVTPSADPLSNKNGGYGFKVWCAARRIADTLNVMVAELQSREEGVESANDVAVETDLPVVLTPPQGSFSVAFIELSDGGSTERVAGSVVTAAFFPEGLVAQAGRLFDPADFTDSSQARLILSDHLWRERYRGMPAVVGMAVTLGGRGAVIVGVAPSTFDYPQGVDLWVAKQE